MISFNQTNSLRFGVTLMLGVSILLTVTSTAQTYSLIYSFGGTGNAASPRGYLTEGRDGNLYGTTEYGGAYSLGAVYKMTPTGTMSLLYSFDGATGSNPMGGLTLGMDGNLYGATYYGGTLGKGTVFRVTPDGVLTVLHNFTGKTDGRNPQGSPIQGADGNLYGTTTASANQGPGVIYKLTLSGKLTTLHQFDGSDGSDPEAPLIQAIDGNFYGTAASGGDGWGTAFEITPAGQYSTIYNLNSYTAFPNAPLIQGEDGNFYGVAEWGVNYNQYGGAVFQLTPRGVFTALHYFGGWMDWTGNSRIGLMQPTDGNFYGVYGGNDGTPACAIYQVNPAGDYAVVYEFDFGADGSYWPRTPLFQHTNGLLYGTTYGPNVSPRAGTFYSLDMALKPFISVLPDSGKVTATVGVFGQGLTGTTRVTFNGIATAFTVSSDTYLETTVPEGALSGRLRVMTPSGTLTSNKIFRVTPEIVTFRPPSGTIGLSVVITGTGLIQTTAVRFGGVGATRFTVDSDNQVTATVPEGAQTGRITIKTRGGIAKSSNEFTVTP